MYGFAPFELLWKSLHHIPVLLPQMVRVVKGLVEGCGSIPKGEPLQDWSLEPNIIAKHISILYIDIGSSSP